MNKVYLKGRIIACAILAVIAMVATYVLTGCSTGEQKVADRQIKDMSVESYTETVAALIRGIYAPTSEADFRNVTQMFSEYANPEVTKKFSSVSPDFEYEKFNSDFRWKAKKFGDKSYQPDGKDRLYFEFEVIRNYKHYNVAIEFKLNNSGTIIDYKVFD